MMNRLYFGHKHERSSKIAALEEGGGSMEKEEEEVLASGTLNISKATMIQQIEMKKMLRQNYVTLPFPIIFFVLYIMSVLAHYPVTEMYHMESALKDKLASSGSDVVNQGTTLKYENIGSFDDVFTWMNDTLLPEVFVTEDYNGRLLDEEFFGRTAYFNRVLGALKLERYEASERNCSIRKTYDDLYPICYDSHGKATVTSQFIDADEKLFEARKVIKHLKKNEYIDFGTTKIVITIPTYNGELVLYGVTTLEINIQRGGRLEPKFETVSIPADPYHENYALVIDLVFLASHGFLILNEVRQLYRSIRERTFGTYITSFWNVIDWAVIAAINVTISLWIFLVTRVYDSNFLINVGSVAGSGYNLREEPEVQGRLVSVVQVLIQASKAMVSFRMFCMIGLIILAIRILKHFTFQPRLAILTETVSRSLHEFGPFFVVFAIMFCAYAICGSLLFGGQIEDFQSIWHSMVACGNMLFGNFDFTTIRNQNFTTAVFFYWSYMIICFLILFNMLLAIVLDAYAEVKMSGSTKQRLLGAEIHEVLYESYLDFKYIWIPLRSKQRCRVTLSKMEKWVNNVKKDTINEFDIQKAFNIDKDYAMQLMYSYSPRESKEDKVVTVTEEMMALKTQVIELNAKVDLLVSTLLKATNSNNL